jgi:hypothetical protein
MAFDFRWPHSEEEMVTAVPASSGEPIRDEFNFAEPRSELAILQEPAWNLIPKELFLRKKKRQLDRTH